MGIDVDLLFHPVGQGTFASGHIKCFNSNKTGFSWVYDCGSSSAGDLEKAAVNRLAAHFGGKNPRIDLLVISHFDHDHISGIPYLLSTFDVKRILIPLVPIWARLLVVARRGLRITRQEQALILDPVGTLSALDGDDRPDEIVVVQPPGADDFVPPWRAPDEPESPPLDVHVEKEEDGADLLRESGYRPAPTSDTAVSMLKRSGRIAIGNIWEFVPYNDSKSIRNAPNDLIDFAGTWAKYLLNASSEFERALILESIKDCYESSYKSSRERNRLSLFLFAGASHLLKRRCRDFNGWSRAYPGSSFPDNLRGVLYTGDGTLKTRKEWNELNAFMKPERLAHLIALQVMHHGSRHDWHKGLAAKIKSETAVFTADPTFRYRHPHSEVWDDFASCSAPILVDTRFPCHLTQRFGY